MAIEDVMAEKLAPLTQKMEELKKQLQDEFQAIFKEESKVLFDAYPWLKELSWTQYTPYFNDGDACEFYVNDDVAINGCTMYSDTPYAESWSCVLVDEDEAEAFEERLKNEPELKAEFNEVDKVASQLVGFLGRNEDIALMMFGDHAKVSIQADGVYVEEYEHD